MWPTNQINVQRRCTRVFGHRKRNINKICLRIYCLQNRALLHKRHKHLWRHKSDCSLFYSHNHHWYMNTIVYSVRILHTHIRYIHNIICMWSQFEGKKRASALDEQARIQVSIHTCIFHVLIYVYVCACMFEYYTCGVGNNIHVCMYVCTHMYAHVTHIVVRIRASSASCRMLRTCVHNYAHIYIYT